MCGRYAASARPEDLVEEFEAGDRTGGELRPSWNVAPTQRAPVVVERPPRPEDGDAEAGGGAGGDGAGGGGAGGDGAGGHGEAQPVRQLRLLTWGLVPSWAKDRGGAARMINARAETVLDKPAYRRAALSRRCLVPADGWYEWQAPPHGGKGRKQPFFTRHADGSPVALAGLYEFWRDPAAEPDDPAAWLATYAVLTTDAERDLARIHERMPLVLPRDRWDAWLDPAVRDRGVVAGLLSAPPPGRFESHPVSPRVGSVRQDDPQLVAPLPLDELAGAVVDPATGELVGG